MDKNIGAQVITRLEGLAHDYPECAWLQEINESQLKTTMKPTVKITIDNSYLDSEYKVPISEN